MPRRGRGGQGRNRSALAGRGHRRGRQRRALAVASSTAAGPRRAGRTRRAAPSSRAVPEVDEPGGVDEGRRCRRQHAVGWRSPRLTTPIADAARDQTAGPGSVPGGRRGGRHTRPGRGSAPSMTAALPRSAGAGQPVERRQARDDAAARRPSRLERRRGVRSGGGELDATEPRVRRPAAVPARGRPRLAAATRPERDQPGRWSGDTSVWRPSARPR